MSDQEKLADAMLKLAEAINKLSERLPQAGLGGGFNVYHHHSHSQPMYPSAPTWAAHALSGGGGISSGGVC